MPRELNHQRTRAGAELEDRTRQLILSAPMPALLHCEDGKILLLNEPWTRLSGYTFEELPTIAAWVNLAYPGAAAETKAGIDKLYALENAIDEGEFSIRTKAGETRCWHFSSAPVGKLADGRRVVVSMATDVTEKHRQADERRRLDAELFRAQKLEALVRLAGGVAHDFNNVLATITSAAELLSLTEHSPERCARLADDIIQAAGRAKGFIRQLMAFTTHQEGDDLPSADPLRTMGDVATMLRRVVPSYIELDLDLPEVLAPFMTDSHIEQVVTNLVTNSWHAIGERAGHIIVSCRLSRSDDDEPRVILRVTDDGLGMSKEAAERAIEPFFTTKDRSEGSGLGLSVVHGIVQSYGGSLIIQSEPGQGTTVQLDLPVAEHFTSPARKTSAPARGAGCVLVMDDETRLRSLICEGLELFGFRVLSAGDPEMALELARKHCESLDAAILDYNIPGRTGLQVARELEAIAPRAKMVLLTGGGVDRRQEAQEHVQRYLVKPVSLADLRNTLTELLEA